PAPPRPWLDQSVSHQGPVDRGAGYHAQAPAAASRTPGDVALTADAPGAAPRSLIRSPRRSATDARVPGGYDPPDPRRPPPDIGAARRAHSGGSRHTAERPRSPEPQRARPGISTRPRSAPKA